MNGLQIALRQLSAGILSIQPDGTIWRHARKIGGDQGPRLIPIQATRADKATPNGYFQLQIYHQGQRKTCPAHRLIWAAHYGEPPPDHHIHHVDHNPSNNRLNNLQLIHRRQHISDHNRTKTPWNKGLAYGETDAYQRALQARRKTNAEKHRQAHDLFAAGLDANRVAEQLGICTRQAYTRLQRYRADHHV